MYILMYVYVLSSYMCCCVCVCECVEILSTQIAFDKNEMNVVAATYSSTTFNSAHPACHALDVFYSRFALSIKRKILHNIHI